MENKLRITKKTNLMCPHMKLTNTQQTVINKKSTGTLISGVKTKYDEEKVGQQAYYFVHHKSDKK